MRDREPLAPAPLSLDLLPRAVVARRARAVGVAAALLGVLLAVALLTLVPVVVAVGVAVLLAGPVVLWCTATARREVRLQGRVLVVRGLRTRRLDLADVDRVSLVVVPRGFRTVSVVLGPGRGLVTVPVALVLEQGARELDALALRRLADALLTGGSVPGVAVAQVLVAALRAQARDAGPGERPLHRAVALAAARAPRAPRVELTPAEVAELGG